MLDKVNLDIKLGKKEYHEIFPKLQFELETLQRKVVDGGVPVIIIFEGWEAAGKGTTIGTLVRRLDPRGIKVHHTKAPNEEEVLRPFMWRFWLKLPSRGEIGIFDRSWYGRVLVERVDKIASKKEWMGAYDEINEAERQLTADGAIIIKFWLHIGKKEQKKRFNRFLKDPYRGWKITKTDWKHHKAYDKFLEAAEDMLKKTSTPCASWTVIEAQDKRYSSVKVVQTVIEAIKAGLDRKAKRAAKEKPKAPEAAPTTNKPSVFTRVDLTKTMTKEEYAERLDELQERLVELEYRMYEKRLPAIVLYEGWDAAGKGGNIKRITEKLDPRGYSVIPIAAPKGDDATHHYLWRFWRHLPKAGHLTIFDRTWYGRVMVERIEGFCAEEEWKRAYDEINEFEGHLANFGMVIVKFWIHIGQDEQLRRFKERESLEFKKWKLTDEDWRNREKWPQYERAISDLIEKCSTPYAPWTIIEGNCKYWARIKALETLCNALEAKL